MKNLKCLFLSLLLITLISCDSSINNNNHKNENKQEPQKFALQLLLDSCLRSQPNSMNNDVSRSILADSIKVAFQKHIGDTLPFLSDIPLTFEMSLEYPPSPFKFYTESYKNAGKYVVKFGFGEITSKFTLSPDYKVSFQVFTIMEKEQVASLVDNGLYRINGTFIDFANNSAKTGFVLPSGKCLIDYPKVIFIDKKPYFSLGTLILENITLEPLNRNK